MRDVENQVASGSSLWRWGQLSSTLFFMHLSDIQHWALQWRHRMTFGYTSGLPGQIPVPIKRYNFWFLWHLVLRCCKWCDFTFNSTHSSALPSRSCIPMAGHLVHCLGAKTGTTCCSWWQPKRLRVARGCSLCSALLHIIHTLGEDHAPS